MVSETRPLRSSHAPPSHRRRSRRVPRDSRLHHSRPCRNAGPDYRDHDHDHRRSKWTRHQRTPQQAITIAQGEAGNGLLYSIELDWSEYDDAWVYGIDILNGTTDYEFDVSADTGEILNHDQDDSDDQEQEVSLDSPMTWATALDKALGAAQGRITGWELDWEDGHPTFEFEIEDSSGDEIEVEVQADTGTVTIND